MLRSLGPDTEYTESAAIGTSNQCPGGTIDWGCTDAWIEVAGGGQLARTLA